MVTLWIRFAAERLWWWLQLRQQASRQEREMLAILEMPAPAPMLALPAPSTPIAEPAASCPLGDCAASPGDDLLIATWLSLPTVEPDYTVHEWPAAATTDATVHWMRFSHPDVWYALPTMAALDLADALLLTREKARTGVLRS